jgi:2-polyprenyl-6-methoxyphenol hydroxylase-like FAD-dependent oxidoreductase
MLRTDIAIVGGGLAGSTAAAMLGRAGIDTVLIDAHAVYPDDFRCEKLDASQVRLLHKTGLADPVLHATTQDFELWIACFGRLIDRRENHQHGIMYPALVNTMRAQIPPTVAFIPAKVTAITTTSSDRQKVTLSNGEEISARLVVLANGLNVGLRHQLGMVREERSPCHSIAIGFDLKPVGHPRFAFPALTYYPERATDQMAYLTLFPVGPETMRANLMVYRDMRDPWLKQMRDAPRDTLFAALPKLRKLMGDFEVSSFVKIRPTDLYVTSGYRQPGVVLIGDAFATACPAAGTGCNKVFTDVERLCNVHIPQWLVTPGMGEEKIAAFYDDPLKQASDRSSEKEAYFLRSISTDLRLSWQLRRYYRVVRWLRDRVSRQRRGWFSARPLTKRETPAASSVGS